MSSKNKFDDGELVRFYSFQIVFITFILIFTSLYIKTKNYIYLILGIVSFIIQNIYFVIETNHIMSKYGLYWKRIGYYPIYLAIYNLIVLLITIFMTFFIISKNYLFLILVIVFLFIHLLFYNLTEFIIALDTVV